MTRKPRKLAIGRPVCGKRERGGRVYLAESGLTRRMVAAAFDRFAERYGWQSEGEVSRYIVGG